MSKLLFKKSIQIVIGFIAATLIASTAGAAELTIGTRADPSIDPHFMYLGTNANYAAHIYGTLVKADEDKRIKPFLATSWKPIDDTTWEFKLRKGVKFHNGTDFTAEDVIFTINRIPNVPNNPNPYTINTRSIADIKVLDPYTIRFKTKKPNPILPARLSDVAIVCKKVAEGATTADFTSGKAAVGAGPFKFVKYVPGDRLVLARNDNFWGEKPPWDQVTFRIITNDAARIAALLAGDVDMVDFVPPVEVARLEQNKNIQIWKRPSNRVIYLLPDIKRDKSPFVVGKDGKPLEKNPLKDLRVRKALSMAIDRETICARVMEGLANPAGQLVPKGWYSYNPDIKVERYDPVKAKKLLAEAGYADGFGLTIHGPNDRYVNDAKICQAVAQMLARIGLDMKVDTMPKAIYFPRCRAPKSEFSFHLVGWASPAGDSSGALLGVLHTYDKTKGMGQYNKGGYSNTELDRIAEEAATTVDPLKREELLQKAMEIGMRELGAIPLHEQFVTMASRKEVTYTPRCDGRCDAVNAKPAP